MSKTETPTIVEETFASKLGVEMVSPRVFAELIELNAGTPIVVCAIGPSGIGKTAIPRQVAAKRNGGKGVPYVPLFMPTASQEGFFIPTTATDTKTYFDQRIPRIFQPLLEYAEAMDKKHKGDVPIDQCPILAVEELNRAADKSVTRAAFVLIGDRMIGDVRIPDCVQIVATMNPTGGGMSVNEFEKDPAMRRRLLSFGVAYSYSDFMQHATTSKFHPSVLGHLGAQPSHGYDEQALLAGKAFACPATWETVSRICRRFDDLGASVLSPAGRAAIAGAIGVGSAIHFLDFVRDHSMVVTPEDVLTSYGPESEARRRFQTYLTEDGGRFDKITELTMGLAVKLFQNFGRKFEEFSPPLACFMNDLPTEILMAFTQRLVEESNRTGQEGKQFLQVLNQRIGSDPMFKGAVRKLHDAKRLGNKETQAPT